MKLLLGIVGVAAVAVATSVGFAQLRAATGPLLDYCPATPASDAGTCVVAANMMVAVGNPSDDELVAGVNAIAGQVQAGRISSAACADAAGGINVLAAGIDDAATRAMAEALAAALCSGGRGTVSGAAVSSIGSLSTPVTAGPTVDVSTLVGTSNGSVGQSSNGSVGQSSNGSVGQSSNGSVGQSSNGSVGQSSNGSVGQSSNGSVGQSSNGSVGQSSNGSVGQSSGGIGGI